MVKTLPRRLAEVRQASDPDAASELAVALLEEVGFPKRAEVPGGVALVGELAEAQREVADGLDRTPLFLGEYALPASLRIRRRWLGQSPPGVLERAVAVGEGGTRPLWWVLLQGDGELGELDLWSDLTPAERHALAADIALEAYGLEVFDEDLVLEVATELAATSDGADVARAFAAYLSAVFVGVEPVVVDGIRWARGGMDTFHERGGLNVATRELRLLAVLPQALAGETLAPRDYWLIPTGFGSWGSVVRTCVLAVPDADRAEAVDALLTDEVSMTAIRMGLEVLAYAPSELVARRVLAAIRNERSLKGRRKRWLDRVRAIDHPAVRAAFDGRAS